MTFLHINDDNDKITRQYTLYLLLLVLNVQNNQQTDIT